VIKSSINQKVLLLQWTIKILFLNLKRTCALKSRKLFRRFKPKYVDYPFQWGARCKLLIAASQSADGRNRLAPILLIEGISFPRNANEIV
jgi:hypothetical protein